MMKSTSNATPRRFPACRGEELPRQGLVLEVASGGGDHAVHSRALPRTNMAADERGTRREDLCVAEGERVAQLPPGFQLDAAGSTWDVTRVHAVVCINSIHIEPWSAWEDLMDARVLDNLRRSFSTGRSSARRRACRRRRRTSPSTRS